MGSVKKIILALAVLGPLAFIGYVVRRLTYVPPLPVLEEDFWWGPGKAIQLGASVMPFKIEVPKEVIVDLNQRLDRYLRRNQTKPLENQGFEYGFNSDYLKTVVTYWRNEYQWKQREAYLNQYPHFKTIINGINIHFMRVTTKSTPDKKVLPLLLLHGWPGSIREFYDLIPLLTTPRDDTDFVFDLIIPSLPGYGYSQGSAKPGMGTAQVAVIMKNLMKRLGFEQFYVQGGDWGAIISAQFATLFPKNVQGIHLNFCGANSVYSNLKTILGDYYPPLVVEEKWKHRMYPLKNHLSFIVQEMGYAHIQATKPDTIGTALRDTPVGLAAYILEKFSTWTNPAFRSLPDGGLTKKYSLDALLDNVMIYWTTGSITTSQRLYTEYFCDVTFTLDMIPIKVPTACARFEHELIWYSDSLLRDRFVNLLQISDIDDGGHFAAFEKPVELSEDIWAALKIFETHNKLKSKDEL